jgi:hypothetical protein
MGERQVITPVLSVVTVTAIELTGDFPFYAFRSYLKDREADQSHPAIAGIEGSSSDRAAERWKRRDAPGFVYEHEKDEDLPPRLGGRSFVR